jgi:hypothetical protein
MLTSARVDRMLGQEASYASRKCNFVFRDRVVTAMATWLPPAVGQGVPQAGANERYNAGLEHVAASRWNVASEAFKQAIRLDPKDADAHARSSICSQTQPRPPPAQPGQLPPGELSKGR